MNFPDRERVVAARSAGFCFFSFLLFFLLLVAVPVANAQSAALGGIVMDPASAVVPNAQVTLTNERTAVAQHAKTNGTGLYTVPFLQPGKYTLAVEAQGFKRYERTGIAIETAQTVAIDVKLQIGSTSESVAVNGSGTYMNTTDASVSTVVDRQFVENIPLNGRSFQSLMTSIPGVTVVASNASSSTNGVGGSGEITVNGQRTESNYFTVDGVSANSGASSIFGGGGYSGSVPAETALGTTQSMVSIDDLQEFRATTSSYSAEYWRTPGGQFTFTTRSGTNDWHGSAFEYLRNNALDANNWFNNYYGVERPPERQNDFGCTLGGPVELPHLYNGRDRTFFFFSYEGLRLQQPQSAQQYEVPTLALRQLAPSALKPFLNAFPLPSPNQPDLGTGMSYFVSGYNVPSSLDSTSIRIDHSFSDNFRVFGRYAYAPSSTVSRSASSLSVVTPLDGGVKSLTLGSTNLFAQKISNEARFNVTWNEFNRNPSADNFGGATPFAITDVSGLGASDWAEFQIGYDTYPAIYLNPQTNHQRQWNVTDNATLSVRRHLLKWGIDYRRTTSAQSLPKYYVLASPSDTDDVANNQMGYLNTIFSQGAMTPVYQNFSAYLQDEWKAASRLSLSLGVRWDVNPAPHDAYGNNPYTVTSLDLATVKVAPKNTPLWNTAYGNFAPRLGVAYQIHQQPGYETILRAGAGLFYDTGNVGVGGYYEGVGISSQKSFSGSAFPLTEEQLESMPAPSVAAPYNASVTGFDPHLKAPYTLQWNVAVQQALGQNQNLTLSYVGAAGRRLLLEKVYQPSLSGNPNFVSSLYLTGNAASSDYNSLQVQFQRRLSHGLQALLSYTWAHAFDNVTYNFTVYADERAPSSNDIRNNFQAALTYDIPGSYSNRVENVLLKGWSLDGRVTARSATPVDLAGNDYARDSVGTIMNFHPNRVPGVPIYINASGAPGGRLINYNAFETALDANGNAIEGDFPRNGVRGFDAVQEDAALRREFSFTEKVGLQFRVEAFNVLNHPIYGSIYNQLSYGPSLFGMAYQTLNSSLGGLSPLYQVGGPRSLQVALRLHF